jgi:hypothetical protein
VEAGGQGQSSLRRLLRCYAALDPDVGYCQGMGFIAGLFLTYMVEDHAFYTFYAVLQVKKKPFLLFPFFSYCYLLVSLICYSERNVR